MCVRSESTFTNPFGIRFCRGQAGSDPLAPASNNAKTHEYVLNTPLLCGFHREAAALPDLGPHSNYFLPGNCCKVTL